MKRSKFIYIIGSIIIGVTALLIVLFGLIAGGVINATQTKLVFASATEEFTYDGKAHKDTEWTLVDGKLKGGHTAKVTVSGSQTDVGTSENFISAVIVDGNGADVTKYYEIEYQSGTLTVNARKLTVSSGDKSKVYDGTPLTYTESDDECEVADGELVKGHTLTAVYTGSITEAGRTFNTFAPHVFDERGREKTANYSITCSNGVLEVTKRRLTVISLGAEKEYDGLPLTQSSYKMTENGLVAGHAETVTISGVQLDAGSSDNNFTVTISADGKDVTNNYDISTEYGTLTVHRRAITITTESAEKIYDGTPLTAAGFEITSGALLDGHVLDAFTDGAITIAGKTANGLTYNVKDVEGNDILYNYGITIEYGTLTVHKRGLTIVSDSVAKIYDGTPLTSKIYTLSEGSLLDGHTEQIEVFGSQTEAGESPNEYEVIGIFDASGEDVTKNYEITRVQGMLNVAPRPITLETLPGHWIYDGEVHSNRQFKITSQIGIPEGHELQAVMPAEITDVGTSDNCISEVTVIFNGEDVTKNYEFTFCNEKLYVVHRPVTIRSGSAEKGYDGTPLTCIESSIVSNYRLVNGHSYDIMITGSRTEPGESDNSIAYVTITDGAGDDISYNYEITKDCGVLRVLSATPPEKDDNDLDDSGEIKGDENDENNDKLAVTVLSEKSGKIYLRYLSYGNYDGKKWSTATPYGRQFDGFGANYLTSVALANAGYASYTVSIDVYGNNYLLPYYTDLDDCLYEIQTSDVKYTGSTANAYICYYIAYDYVADGAIPNSKLTLGKYADFEEGYRAFVYENYLTSGAGVDGYLDEIIAAQKFDKSDPDIIKKVAKYIQGAAKYNLKYDKALDGESNIVLSFLRDYKEGICQHYASAATLLYRRLGIPARYVAGYTGETKAGEKVELTGKNAHAWTEVYIDGMGWVCVEVTGGTGLSQGGGDGMKISPVNEYHKYDGITHFHSNTLQGLSSLLKEGYTYKAEVSGSRSAAGKTVCKIVSFTLFYDGKDVTDKFLSENKVNFGEGFLQVYLSEITVTTGGGEKMYDGAPLTSSEISWNGNLLAGHSEPQITATGSQQIVGVSRNVFDIKIFDGEGNDVTDVYKVNGEYGTLTVTARSLTVTANSAEKYFDKTKLEDGGYKITFGEVAEGQTIEVKISGSQIAIGKSENKVVSVKIYDGGGADVTANYLITTVNGWLTVKLPA